MNEFETDMYMLRDEFESYAKLIRDCKHDGIQDATRDVTVAFGIMMKDTRAMYSRRSGFGSWWIESLYDTFTNHAAELFALINKYDCYKPLLPALNSMDWCATELVRMSKNIEANVDKNAAAGAA